MKIIAETIKMVIETSSWMSEALKMTEGLEIYRRKGGGGKGRLLL
jgi:hypothetical protein